MDKEDKEEDNDEIPPLPSRAGRVSKASVAALPKSMFQNPMKHKGRVELKEREEDEAIMEEGAGWRGKGRRTRR